MLDSPDLDQLNYDTFLMAFMMTFQSVTLEGWSEIMMDLERTYSRQIWIYSIPMCIIGAMGLINLLLAILQVKFSEVTGKI